MHVISTNVGSTTLVNWKGKDVETGIFKKPVTTPIQLSKEKVDQDQIADKRVHGGIYKACYLFGSNYYAYWKEKYPNLSWDWGMFGENLTIDRLNEEELHIGDVFQIGTALVKITQPREPCFKLGIRFKNQNILKEFIAHAHPGFYIQVQQEGKVQIGDPLILKKKSEVPLSVQDFYKLLFDQNKNIEHLKMAISHMDIPIKKRTKLQKLNKKGGHS